MRKFTVKNDDFICLYCGFEVKALKNGSCRNHCPKCLYSLHLDVFPGDRNADCGGFLEPIGVEFSGKKGWIIIHKCQRCAEIKRNKAALNDLDPDDFQKIIELSKKPSF